MVLWTLLLTLVVELTAGLVVNSVTLQSQTSRSLKCTQPKIASLAKDIKQDTLENNQKHSKTELTYNFQKT